jgi:Rps23 Pro-64 3,4-dihydroxylase Tpa1-like proline 4-hydroxylase
MQNTRYFDLSPYRQKWLTAHPFPHLILDDFLDSNVAFKIVDEFPSFGDESWRVYNNVLEIKKILNHWDKFGPYTYRLFDYLNSAQFISILEKIVDCRLYADPGLNGGGLHTHSAGGKLNVHLDYSIHPKTKLQRKINLLIYLTPNWDESWGGELGFWHPNQSSDGPGDLAMKITPRFNRAVIFDTTKNSWHGLPDPISSPEDVCRNSLAVYYLCEPDAEAPDRGKALFAPYMNQVNDEAVLELIRRRSETSLASGVYGDKQ